MKIALISFVTPASENIRGTSALPYHLLKEREDNVDVKIYSFNCNGLSNEKIQEVEKELEITIKVIPLPRWYIWMFRFHLLFLRVFLKYPFANYIKLPQYLVDEISSQNPDLIWVMGEELSRVVKQFPEHRRIQLGPDTESLYYYRMMGRRFVMKNFMEYWKCALMYKKYARMERAFCTDENFTFYAVGEEDIRHLQQLNPKVQAKFLRHPHYEVSNKLKTEFHQPKIRLLIAGQYNLYMKQDGDLLIKSLSPIPSPKERGIDDLHKSEKSDVELLKEHYMITFLGKGWEKHVESLREAGYDVEHIKFAPDYIKEICRHDIQLTPIAIGTGTKGKVLDALANGLLVIGTPYAMENIAVKNGESCIEYQYPEEVIEILKDIPMNIEKYEAMANAGRDAVLRHHDRHLLSLELFSLNH